MYPYQVAAGACRVLFLDASGFGGVVAFIVGQRWARRAVCHVGVGVLVR
jgi:hypothetical protein